MIISEEIAEVENLKYFSHVFQITSSYKGLGQVKIFKFALAIDLIAKKMGKINTRSLFTGKL